MARYFLHRFLLTLPALWLVLTMVFLLIHIVPGDPVEQMLGESAAPGQAVELRHTLGLDRPLIIQYGKYLWQVARGDFGQSFKFQAPVRRVIFEPYPATLQLALLALFVCMAIAFAAFFGPGIGKVILALIITGWAGYARLARAQVLKTKELEFVLAARSLGASPLRIMIRHLLPNMIQPVLVQATIGMAGAILAEATLSFLGLGVLAPIPSWGAMLNDARNHLFDAPHMVVFPALAVVLAVLAFNLLGDAWRDWLNPRTRSQMTAVEQSR
jgi:ABC-type dipeptide/oligopeptide/nickel transport system permease component